MVFRITDSIDGEKDIDRDSKRSSVKTYSSDTTDPLSRNSPLPYQSESSPPPILISRTYNLCVCLRKTVHSVCEVLVLFCDGGQEAKFID